jgi:hypothetical protein
MSERVEVPQALLSVAFEALGRSTPDRTTPPERVRLLAGVVPPLLALHGGGAKLDEWVARVPAGESRAQLRRRLREHLALYGDITMAGIVIETLATVVPPVVTEFVMSEVGCICVGWESAGWAARSGIRGSELIVLSGARRDADALARLTCHELAHAWHRPPGIVEDLHILTAVAEQNVLAMAHEQDWPALAEVPAREDITDATALSWFCAAS